MNRTPTTFPRIRVPLNLLVTLHAGLCQIEPGSAPRPERITLDRTTIGGLAPGLEGGGPF